MDGRAVRTAAIRRAEVAEPAAEAVPCATSSKRGAPSDMATPTGLEPATSAVTGRRANQLRYGALKDLTVLRWQCVPPTGFEPVLPP